MNASVRLVHEFCRLFFKDKKRIKNYIYYWFSRSGLQLNDFFLDVLQPLKLRIVMDGIYFLNKEEYKLPFRELTRNELSCLHNLLKQHHTSNNKLFECEIGMRCFSLKYQKFKYDAILNQQFQPILYLNGIYRMSLSFFTKEDHVAQLHLLFQELFYNTAQSYLLNGHPIQKSLIQIGNGIGNETGLRLNKKK